MNKKNKTVLTVVIAGAAVIALAALVGYYGNTDKDNGAAKEEPKRNYRVLAAADSALIGKQVPDFSLTDMAGNEYTPEKLKGKEVVLFFNEGLMCYPACWNQVAAFGSDPRFNSEELVALSVVVDPKADWAKAMNKMPELAKATVLFDEGAKVSGQFNVLKMRSSMHYGALPGHTYVVIGKDGIVRGVYDDPTMATRNDEVYTMMKNMMSGQ